MVEEAEETVWYANAVGLTLLRRAALDGYTGQPNGGVLLPKNKVTIEYICTKSAFGVESLGSTYLN